MKGTILIVDDDRGMCEMLHEDLTRRGFAASWKTSAEEAFDEVLAGSFDVVLTDLVMPGTDGIALCERLVANRPDVLVVVITAFGNLDTAVAALRAGAYDFVSKPIDLETLAHRLHRAVQHRDLQHRVTVLSRAVEESERFDELVGSSPPMQQLYDTLGRVADTESSVLLTGESGTGKELAARALHNRSRRAAGPFVAVNCAAMPEALLESELFGHARGAFTDARAQRSGLFVQAHEGTLLLDEIADMPLSLQSKLLRALEQRTVRPVGANAEVPFDARVVASTNRDLDAAVEEGRFREDLFYRVNVIRIELPPLRARGNDILLLAQRFVEHYAALSQKEVTGISPAAAQKVLAYGWPGNVRELRNCIERAVALTRFDAIAVEDLPDTIRSYRGSRLILGSDNPAELLPMEEIERRYILHVLEAVGGNKTLAARTLGLDRKTLYRKLEGYGIRGNAS
jgi:two-component system response regulator HydG